MKRFDIAIIGGGAAGLAAAISAKRTYGYASVGIIERLPKTGKKILATGNGRCNLSNADLHPDRYHGSCKKLLSVTGTVDIPAFFESLGVMCEDDGFGRIYPRCRSAASVLDALRLECDRLGVETVCGFDVTKLELNNYSGRKLFVIRSESDSVSAFSVILAGGGKSQAALGSNGSLLDICKNLGIKIQKPYPALVPLKTEPGLVRALKGLRTDANVMFKANGNVIASRRGEVQFTEGLISGICVFDLSYLYEEYKDNSGLILDLLPEMSTGAVTEILNNIRNIRSEASSEDFLSGIFTRALGIYILKRAVAKCPKKTGDIDDRKLRAIAETIKSLSFPVTGTAGFERSQVTGGGIIADEINENFAVLKMQGLYACGEMLDIFGDCGGYNLDFAFSSGIAAGKAAALRAKL